MTLSWIYTIQSLHSKASYTGEYILGAIPIYSTYEVALEEGIKQALKLIKDENQRISFKY